MSRPTFPPFAPPLLIAFDLDGTLVPDGANDLPEVSALALGRLRQLTDVYVAIITGRDMVPPQVMQAAHPDAVVTNNGGRIEIGGQLHLSATFSEADLDAALAHGLEQVRLALFTEDKLYLDLPPGMEPQPWMRARDYRPMADAPREGVVKLGYFHPEIAQFAERLRQTHPHLVLTGAQDPYLEYLSVTPAGAHKGAGLTLVAEALGVPLTHTVACGDSDNDLAMLELAGFAVQSGDLPLLMGHADVQVSGPQALGEYLQAWVEALSHPE